MLVRDASKLKLQLTGKKVRVLTGDATDAEAVASAVESADAVISCLGYVPKKGCPMSVAYRHIIEAAARQAKPKLLEPMMAVEVVTPDDFLGDVVSDVNARRGQVQGTESRGLNKIVNALVPLSEMFGYANDLRSRTQGRASYSMLFDSYKETPASVQEEIVKRIRGE